MARSGWLRDSLDFSFYPLRFHFRALDPVQFPPGQASNVLRGGFGLMLREQASQEVYRRLFEPCSDGLGPSGLKDLPRPFVLRAAHLDGKQYAGGECFYFDLNLFDTRVESILALRDAFEALMAEGVGPGRGRATLELLEMMDPKGAVKIVGNETIWPKCVTIQLTAGVLEVPDLRVAFVTPLELKAAGQIAGFLEFSVLFARLRDRISTLRALYGAGPLTIDFKQMGISARKIQSTGSALTAMHVRRRSSRTGQAHEIGGVIGWASYHGELQQFLPYLQAGEWCGVGRHCVWGNGQIRVTPQMANSS